MSAELVETCDVCGQVVPDVLKDGHTTQGYGYVKVKRIVWRFGPWPRFWHREDRGVEYICDLCLDAVRELRDAALARSPFTTPQMEDVDPGINWLGRRSEAS